MLPHECRWREPCQIFDVHIILHEADRQIPLQMAQKTLDAATNSPHAELKVFTTKTGGVEHCQVDNANGYQIWQIRLRRPSPHWAVPNRDDRNHPCF